MNDNLYFIVQIILSLLRIFRVIYISKPLPKIVNNKYNDITNKNITICTWNIQCLFCYMNNKIIKLNNIINNIKLINTDLFLLQEVFDDFSKKYIIKNLSNIYPNYLLGNCDKKYIFGEDSGLLVLSKYKIEYLKEIILDGYRLPDSLSNKSALFFKINDIIICNTHLQSSHWRECSTESNEQIIKLLKYYDNFILVGDLNNGYIYDGIINTKNINNNITNPDENKILDYIISNNDYYNIISNTLYFDLKLISDHYPVVGTIIL